MSFLVFDIINYITLLILIIFIYYKKILDFYPTILLIIVSILPMFMFGFLFEPHGHFWGDADFYQWSVNKARQFKYFELYHTRDVRYTSIVYSFIPIPFVHTYNSVGFITKFIYILLIAFVGLRIKSKSLVYFLIIYPSAILYSSIGLKDTLVLVIMTIMLIFMLERKNILFAIFAFFLILIKFQNGILLIFIYIFYHMLVIRKIKYFILSLLPLFICLYFISLQMHLLKYFNLSSINNLYVYFQSTSGVKNINTLNQNIFIVIDLLKGFFYFHFRPNFFNFETPFQFIQAIENLIIFILFCFLVCRLFLIDKFKTIFWFLSFAMISSLYGLIVYNAGSLVRYKYAIIISFLIAVYYDFKKKIK